MLKKLLSFLLAAAMLAGIAATAFAADAVASHPVDDIESNAYLWNDDKRGVDLTKPANMIPYGETAYFPLIGRPATGPSRYVYEKAAAGNMKVSSVWEEGGSYVDSIEVVKKKITADSGSSMAEGSSYIYFLAIEIENSASTTFHEVLGEITIKQNGNKDYAEVDEITFDICIEVGHSSDLYMIPIEPATFKEGNGFESVSEFEFSFEADPNSYFVVNTKGQGKIVLGMNTEKDDVFCAKYPLAELSFFNGNYATFNRTGTLYIANNNPNLYIYSISSDGDISEVSTEYDASETAYVIRTRTLGRYVLSDLKLDINSGSSPAIPSPPADDKKATKLYWELDEGYGADDIYSAKAYIDLDNDIEFEIAEGSDKGLETTQLSIQPKLGLKPGVYYFKLTASGEITKTIIVKLVVYADTPAANDDVETDEKEIDDGYIDSIIDNLPDDFVKRIDRDKKVESFKEIMQNSLKGIIQNISAVIGELIFKDIVPVSVNGTDISDPDDAEAYFAKGKKIPVTLPLPAGFDPNMHDLHVAHMFVNDWGRNTPGDIELFSTKNAAGVKRIVIDIENNTFMIDMSGFSPLVISVTQRNTTASSTGNGEISLEGPYMYDADINVMMTETEAGEAFEYGDSVYYLINDDTYPCGGCYLEDKECVEDMKLKSEFIMGGDLVEDVRIVKKYIDVDVRRDDGSNVYYCASNLDDADWYYFIEIVTKKDIKVYNEGDVQGVIEFNRKGNSKKSIAKIKNCKVDIDFTLFYAHDYTGDNKIVDDKADIIWGETYALKFDNDEEIELSFGSTSGGNNEGIFTVDVSGQGKVLLSYNTDPYEDIADANEGVKMNFIRFNNACFNRTGEFVYEMEDGVAAYRIVDGKLIEIPHCYDKGEGAFVFTTRILEEYVFANAKLNMPA